MMHISRKAFLSVVSAGAASLAFPGIAAAQRSGYRWEVFQAGFVKWEIPAPWITTVDGNVLKTRPNDGGALVLEFVGISNPNADLGGIVRDELGKRMTNPRLTEPETPKNQNGLTGSKIRGEGTSILAALPGPLEFRAFVLRHPASGLPRSLKGVLAFAFWKTGQYAKHQGYIDVTFDSIQPN
jgi:hypothetical protein